MNLRERVLEKVPRGGISARDLFNQLGGEQPAAVDCALSAMLRDHTLRLAGGQYFRSSDPFVLGGGLTKVPPVSVPEARPRGATKPRQVVPATPGPVQMPPVVAEKPIRCRVCGEMKAPEEFQKSNLPHGGRLKTCKKCVGMKTHGRKPKGASREPNFAPAVLPDAPPARVQAKARSGPASSPSGEPLRPRARASSEAVALLVHAREVKAERIADLEERLADMRKSLGLIDELIAVVEGGG